MMATTSGRIGQQKEQQQGRIVAWGLMLLMLCSGLSGCGSDKQTEPGKYLFAVTYSNHAWGKTSKGLVVTAQGDLYQYDVSTTAAELPEPGITSDDALSRYFEAARFEFVRALDKTQLDNLWRASQQMQNTTLTAPASICRDAGQFQYLVFQPKISQQQMVLLYQTGDFRREQTDRSGDAARAYLMQLAQELKIAWLLDPTGNNWCSGL